MSQRRLASLVAGHLMSEVESTQPDILQSLMHITLVSMPNEWMIFRNYTEDPIWAHEYIMATSF
jgi:hypothetical protein